MHKRMALPIIPMSYALSIADHALSLNEIDEQPLAASDVITQAFEQARETIQEIETARDCWSPAQAAAYRSKP